MLGPCVSFAFRTCWLQAQHSFKLILAALDAQVISFEGDTKETAGGILEVEGSVDNLYFVASNREVFKEEPDLNAMPVGSLAQASAHW